CILDPGLALSQRSAGRDPSNLVSPTLEAMRCYPTCTPRVEREWRFMALNVSAWSIRQPLPAIIMAAVLIALGLQRYFTLPITRLPNIDLPVIAVLVTQFGAAPSELEAQVTKVIEDTVAGIEGVHHINSTTTDGISNTTITFRLETNPDRALNDV